MSAGRTPETLFYCPYRPIATYGISARHARTWGKSNGPCVRRQKEEEHSFKSRHLFLLRMTTAGTTFPFPDQYILQQLIYAEEDDRPRYYMELSLFIISYQFRN